MNNNSNNRDSDHRTTPEEASSTTSHVVPNNEPPPPLRESAEVAIAHYLQELEGDPASGLHDMVLAQVEEPLLKAIMGYTAGNQSRAAHLLGLNRGTLRKKLRRYGLIEGTEN